MSDVIRTLLTVRKGLLLVRSAALVAKGGVPATRGVAIGALTTGMVALDGKLAAVEAAKAAGITKVAGMGQWALSRYQAQWQAGVTGQVADARAKFSEVNTLVQDILGLIS